MANENTYVVTGLVDQLDNKDIAQAFVEGQTQRAGKPLRVLPRINQAVPSGTVRLIRTV